MAKPMPAALLAFLDEHPDRITPEGVRLLVARLGYVEAQVTTFTNLVKCQGEDVDHYRGERDALKAENEKLRAAIRKHRDYRGDHRCFQDDAELYAALPEGDTRPATETAVTIENCERYIACRQGGREYVSPQDYIEELEGLLREAANELVDAVNTAESYYHAANGPEVTGLDGRCDCTSCRICKRQRVLRERIAAILAAHAPKEVPQGDLR